jgi:CarboxypepD_reg-like domain/TonB-dependent Receptor Plug Domain
LIKKALISLILLQKHIKMNAIFLKFITFFLFFLPILLCAQTGIIKGRIVDAKNNAPVAFANVLVENINLGTNTDEEGYYEITNLEPQLYNLTASYLGYQSKTQADIQVTNSKPAIIDFNLEEYANIIDEVIVKASPFLKTEESPVSLRTIGSTEVQRNPGGNRDVSRVIRILPGVTSTSNNRNDLLIRGGAPSENRFYLDDIEVPNINHFSTQGASGGANGLLNVDVVQEVNFYSGAFPVNRGNALSSVFNFKQKNGRDDRLGFTLTSGTSEAALSLEGPLSKDKKTTAIFSIRQSYLQLLFKAIGLPFLPTYNDSQFKIRRRHNEKHESYVVFLGSLDNFSLNLDANKTAQQRFLLNSLPVYKQWSYALGAVHKYSVKKGFWTFVLSRNMLDNSFFKYKNNDESQPKVIDYVSQESENKLRVENTSRFGTWRVNYGIGLEYVRYFNKSQDFVFNNGQLQTVDVSSELKFARYGSFANVSNKFFNQRLIVSAGARIDGTSFSTNTANPFSQFSPRVSAAYAITEKVFFNFNAGIYYQLPAYTALGFRQNGNLINQSELKFIRANHLVAGFEYLSKNNLKITIEGYYKQYSNYPFILGQQISLANIGNSFGVVGNTALDSRGTGRTYGLEFLVQQSFYKNFYGILSYTLGKAEFSNGSGAFIPASWDSRHIVNLAVGKIFNIVNKETRSLKDTKRISKGKNAISKKIVNQNLEFGLNLRLQTGLPYTPFDTLASALTNNWNRIGQGILDFSRLNTLRTPAVYSADFRIDYKWFYPKWSFNLYLDIQNLPGVVNGSPSLILDQGADENQPAQIINAGQPNESYKLAVVPAGKQTVLPTIGIIIQY